MKKQNNIIIIAIPALVISIALIGCSEKAITEKSKAKLVSLLDAETPEISDIPVEISELDDLSNEAEYDEVDGGIVIIINTEEPETAVAGTSRETVVEETVVADTPRETVVDETAEFISKINEAKLKWITIINKYKISIDTAYLELQAILSSSSSSISKDEEADLPEEGTAREKFEAAKHAVKEAIRSRDEELTSIREEYNMNEYNL